MPLSLSILFAVLAWLLNSAVDRIEHTVFLQYSFAAQPSGLVTLTLRNTSLSGTLPPSTLTVVCFSGLKCLDLIDGHRSAVSMLPPFDVTADYAQDLTDRSILMVGPMLAGAGLQIALKLNPGTAVPALSLDFGANTALPPVSVYDTWSLPAWIAANYLALLIAALVATVLAIAASAARFGYLRYAVDQDPAQEGNR